MFYRKTDDNLIPENKTTKIIRWSLLTITIFFVVVILVFVTALGVSAKYNSRIYPGIKIAGLAVGGLSKTQATNIINGEFKTTFNQGFDFSTDSTEKNIANENREIFDIHADALAERAMREGRNENWIIEKLNVLIYPFLRKNLALDYKLDKNLLKQKLQTEFPLLSRAPKNSELIVQITDEATKSYNLEFTDSEIGQGYDFDQAIERLENGIKEFRNDIIYLNDNIAYPKVTKENAQKQEAKLKKILALNGLTLKYEENNYEITWTDFTKWLTLSTDSSDQVTVTLDPEIAKGKLDSIAQKINQDPQEPKLLIENNRVTEFRASRNGIKLDIDQSYNKINQEVIENNNSTVELVVNVTEPNTKMESMNDLGIKEKIGEGISDFSGSPVNRRHNIGVGATTLNGILIKPDEEFSLTKTLGSIDLQAGYLPELVIKGNKTVPEPGGGLCQVGTTMFRLILASGLPVTERASHRYRVVYYEPAGTDATIYDPSPDVKFINNTGHYLLLQTKISGNKLMFEFWGTKDGRKVTFEGKNTTSELTALEPIIFNITQPGPAKEIETVDMKPGEKKRIETAHAGADTVFYRTVIDKDGKETKETWKSHYVPWQAVWLIGVDPTKITSETTDTKEPSTTDQLQTPPESVTPPTN